MTKFKCKATGFIDLLITLLITAHLITFVVIPLSLIDNTKSTSVNQPANQIGSGSSASWICIRVGVTIFGSLIPILASIALMKSTSSSITHQESLQIIRFWVHCSVFTILTSTLTFLSVLIIFGYQSWASYPILAFILFRIGMTVHVSLQEVRPALEEASVHFQPMEAQHESAFQFNRTPGIGLGAYRAYRMPGMQASIRTPSLDLRTYKGNGLSAPKCQCISSSGTD